MNTANSQTGKYATVNGLHMYYEIHGTGKPLVLIHGAASTIQTTFGRILPALAKAHQVIGVELQAHGHSDNRDGRQITFEQDADDVAELLRQLKVEKADIFGFSNGGTTALQIAIRHPQLVNKLIVASSMYKRAGVPPAFWEGMKNAKFEDMPEPYVSTFKAINPSREALDIMFNQCAHRMQQFTDIPDKSIAAIQNQTLILIGDQDVSTPEHAVELSRRLPHARLAIIPGGHGTYMGELTTLKEANNPPVALPVILDFLK
ncbi:alpha/beta fold hydrolase [Pedobacter africanus]|uniref:Pimeloyl-ACP methyl ester carboxylesterase n=1 Tax=Pedobacter africanus TaxID=151894 RepID=A0A1W2DX68_9SPHI|nr:alpha/beta hydrolase [Pedobacter africanus]SMD02039.1 Pimeloyl-ACP methyl ester carboxylesterase [Pedobacter africanus]